MRNKRKPRPLSANRPRAKGSSPAPWAAAGALLKSARVSKGWTQDDLGSRLGVGAMMVSRYECGRRRPEATQLYLVESLLGIAMQVWFSEVATERSA